MLRQNWPVYSAIAGFFTVGLVCLVALWILDWVPVRPTVTASVTASAPPGAQQLSQPTVEAAPAAAGAAPAHDTVAGDAAPVQPQPWVTAAPAAPARVSPEVGYYDQLRSRMRWVQTRVGNDQLLTPDLDSRLLLAKSAAGRAGLGALGLSYKDVYGIINAETSWVPRMGASKDGTPNLGIAQFEPATAKALGMRNPEDAVEAVHVAALHMKEAALWSAERIAGLKLHADERASKLREGISIYYNLSTRGRNTWNGRNTRRLPRETQLHIQNARIGAQQAEFFDAQLQAMKLPRGNARAVVTASSQGSR
jgi:hypothetical protein